MGRIIKRGLMVAAGLFALWAGMTPAPGGQNVPVPRAKPDKIVNAPVFQFAAEPKINKGFAGVLLRCWAGGFKRAGNFQLMVSLKLDRDARLAARPSNAASAGPLPLPAGAKALFGQDIRVTARAPDSLFAEVSQALGECQPFSFLKQVSFEKWKELTLVVTGYGGKGWIRFGRFDAHPFEALRQKISSCWIVNRKQLAHLQKSRFKAILDFALNWKGRLAGPPKVANSRQIKSARQKLAVRQMLHVQLRP